MRNGFIRFKRPHERSIDQLLDASSAEVFEQTNLFLNETCCVHDEFSRSAVNVQKDALTGKLDFSPMPRAAFGIGRFACAASRNSENGFE
jgi:hypothetical protein